MMRRNLSKAVLGVVVAMAFGLAGCGGGGGSDAAPATTTQAPIVSAVDGTWKDNSGRMIEDSHFGLQGYIQFSNGNLHTYGWFTSSNINFSKDGTFTVSGNSLNYHLTSSYMGPAPTTISLTPTGSTSTINESHTATFTIAGNQLTLTDGAFSLVFTKQ